MKDIEMINEVFYHHWDKNNHNQSVRVFEKDDIFYLKVNAFKNRHAKINVSKFTYYHLKNTNNTEKLLKFTNHPSAAITQK